MERNTKPGIKTTEFWLSLLAQLIGAVVLLIDALGATESFAAKIVGGVIVVLGALGYAVPRAGVKQTEMLSNVERGRAVTMRGPIHLTDGDGGETDPT